MPERLLSPQNRLRTAPEPRRRARVEQLEPWQRVGVCSVTALAGHPGRDTANTLVAYLARCEKEVDAQGFDAAQDCLQKLASARGPRTLESWQKWAASLPATAR